MKREIIISRLLRVLLVPGLMLILAAPATAFARENIPVSIDNRDLFLRSGVRFDLGRHIIFEGDELDIFVFVLPGEYRHLLLVSFDCQDLVRKVMLCHVLGEVDRQVVDEIVERVDTYSPGLRGLVGDALPHGVDHDLVLFHVLGTRGVADVHFSGALVLAVADQLVVDTKFVQEILEEDHPSPQTKHEVVASMMAGCVDLVGD